MKVKIKPCIKACLFRYLNIQYRLNVHSPLKCVASTWKGDTRVTAAAPPDFEPSIIPLKSALLLSPVSQWAAPYPLSVLSRKPEVQPGFRPVPQPVHELSLMFSSLTSPSCPVLSHRRGLHAGLYALFLVILKYSTSWPPILFIHSSLMYPPTVMECFFFFSSCKSDYFASRLRFSHLNHSLANSWASLLDPLYTKNHTTIKSHLWYELYRQNIGCMKSLSQPDLI